LGPVRFGRDATACHTPADTADQRRLAWFNGRRGHARQRSLVCRGSQKTGLSTRREEHHRVPWLRVPSQGARHPSFIRFLCRPPRSNCPRRRRTPPASFPRRSRRLAAKAKSRLPAVVADQNLLMRKLGLVTDTHVETADFARYIDLFLNGLTEDQVELIRELFKDRCMSIGERGCGSLTVEARSPSSIQWGKTTSSFGTCEV
jgi:hypothetical protein